MLLSKKQKWQKPEDDTTAFKVLKKNNCQPETAHSVRQAKKKGGLLRRNIIKSLEPINVTLFGKKVLCWHKLRISKILIIDYRWWGPKPKCPHCETQVRRKWCKQENRSWDDVCTSNLHPRNFKKQEDSPLQLHRVWGLHHTWILASDSHSCERINFYGFKATILVAICHSSHRKPVHSSKIGSNESKIKTFSQENSC